MIRIDIDINGLQKKLRSIAGAVSDPPEDLLDSLAMTVFNEVKKNFDQQGRPPWAALKPATVASKKKRGVQSGKLKDSGDMFKSIYPATMFGAAIVATSSEIAPFHQFGTSRMVARPFMTLPVKGRQALSDAVAEYIEMLANR